MSCPTADNPRPVENKDRAVALERLPTFSVRRKRLEERLDDVPAGGLGLVLAGAGSGKSVLLSQWVCARPETAVAPMRLADRHNDPTVLGRELLDALRCVALSTDPTLSDHFASGTAGLGAPFFDRLLADLEAHPADVVIVLDDVHHLTQQTLLHDLNRFIRLLPDNVRIAAAARWDPGLGLRQLRMDGRLVEVRAADLAFDDVEAMHLVRSISGCDLELGQTRRLVARTEGWAAGLQIASISLRETPDAAGFVADFTGTDRLMVEYLTDEVLLGLDPAVRTFLLQTSMLPWLTAELCAAVTCRNDAQAVLEFLDDHSLFTIALDRSGTRFRYHQLFAELLLEQAKIELGREEVRRLRLAAATWFRSLGQFAEAMDQLLAAEAWHDAVELVREIGHQFFQRGEAATLVAWLDRVDRGQPDAPPVVAMNLLGAQIAACQFLAAGETYWRIERRRDVAPADRIASEALYTCCGLDHLPAAEVVEVASRVLTALPGIDIESSAETDILGIGGRATIEILPAIMMGIASFHQGDLIASAEMLEWACTLPGMQYPMWRVNALGALAIVRAWSGQLTEAERLGSSALDAAAAVGAPHHVAVTHARLALGLVSILRNDPELAAVRLGVAEPSDFGVRGATDHDTRALLIAHLASLTDGPLTALQLLAEPATGAAPPAIIQRAQRALRAHLQLAAGDPIAARLTLLSDGSDPAAYSARIDLELGVGDTAAARVLLDRWRPNASSPLESTTHGLRLAVLLDAEGATEAASGAMLDAIALAETEWLLRPILECFGASPLIARIGPARSSPFVTALLEADRDLRSRRTSPSGLIDPLTERELSVLVHLPTRLTNADIGRELYMSVNTVKTHLQHIYRKLDVNDRDSAIERAESLGLI